MRQPKGKTIVSKPPTMDGTTRRAFLKRGLQVAAAGTAGARLLTTTNGMSQLAFAEGQRGPTLEQVHLTPGDEAILRFLSAVEILHTVFSQPQHEPAGIQNG